MTRPGTGPAWTADELMEVNAARALAGARTCFVGIGLPSTAANLARRTANPGLVLVYESGAIGARPSRLPLSIGDGELADTADAVVSVPELFNYWLQPGRIDVGFLGAAQLDRHANINTTLVRTAPGRPDLRCPARAAPRRSRRTAARSSSYSATPGAASSPPWTSSPRSATARAPARGPGSACPAAAPPQSSPTWASCARPRTRRN